MALTPKQQVAAQALGSGASVRAAAKTAKCAPASITRWKHEEEFVATVDRETAQFLREVKGLHKQTTQLAIARMAEILRDKENPPAVMIRAARPFLPPAMDLAALNEGADDTAEALFFDRYRHLDRYEEN